MLIGLQLRGLHTGWLLGQREDNFDHHGYERFGQYAEYFFNGVFSVELVLLMYAQGMRFWKDSSNVLDFCIVTSSGADCFILPLLNVRFASWSALRFVRIVRICKVAKFVRYSKTFSELRVAIRTLREAIRGVVWGVMLLFGIILAGVILMTQLASMYLENDSIDLQRRIWVYKNFGTVFASAWTMLECTFTGRWGIYARPIIDE